MTAGLRPPSMAPPPLPPDYGKPQSQGAWQTPPAGNSFNSAGPALATAGNNDDWAVISGSLMPAIGQLSS